MSESIDPISDADVVRFREEMEREMAEAAAEMLTPERIKESLARVERERVEVQRIGWPAYVELQRKKYPVGGTVAKPVVKKKPPDVTGALPATTTPEALAERLGWSPRRVRQFAKSLGACRVQGNRMALTKEDVDAILEKSSTMSLKIYKRGGVWHYRGTVAGRRLRGSCKTTNKAIAQRQAAKIEARYWAGHFDGPGAVLTYAQASLKYRAAGKPTRFWRRSRIISGIHW